MPWVIFYFANDLTSLLLSILHLAIKTGGQKMDINLLLINLLRVFRILIFLSKSSRQIKTKYIIRNPSMPIDDFLIFIKSQVIGCIVRESGFEDIIFEAGVCTSGSLQGVLAGSHYNRCWNVHNVFSESLERVFLKRFLLQLKLEIPHQLSHLSADPQCENVNDELFQSMQDLLSKYDEFREKTRRGFYGETAQFWLIYMDLMRYQLMGHSAIQENDHEKLLHCWQHFIPMYFALNKLHYAR